MKIRYFRETDSLYIELSPCPGEETIMIGDDVCVDIDATGQAIGIGIDHASHNCKLDEIEIIGIETVRMAAC